MSKLTGKLTNKKIGKVKYPSKTSLNLLIQEKSAASNPKVQIAIFVVFIILLLVFVKFMVVDRLVDASRAQSAYEQMQSDIAELKTANEDYDKVREQYSHYGNGYLNEEEKAESDRAFMLNLIDEKVLSAADIQSIEISGNVATLTINDITLRTVSGIVADLEADNGVSYVQVATAGTGQDSSSLVTATFTINFVLAGGEQ